MAVGLLHVQLLAETFVPSLCHEQAAHCLGLFRGELGQRLSESIDFQTVTQRLSGSYMAIGGTLDIVTGAAADDGNAGARLADLLARLPCPGQA